MYKLFQWNYGENNEDLKVVVTYHETLEKAELARKKSYYKNKYIATPEENTSDVWNYIADECDKRQKAVNEFKNT